MPPPRLTEKLCSGCSVIKPISEFLWERRSHRDAGPNHLCKPCEGRASTVACRRYRVEVLTHYGGDPPRCACCGDDHFIFLALDHIGGGGNKHRRELGIRGGDLARWLRSQGYPDGFRVLCHNCNYAEAHGGCPHDCGS